MKGPSDTEEVRNILHQFQNGYKERNIEKLDEFVALFVQDEEIELIGIGAYERGGSSGSKVWTKSERSSYRIGNTGEML